MSIPVIFASAAIAMSLPVLWWSLASARTNASVAERGLLANASADTRATALARSAATRARPTAGALVAFARRLTPQGWIASLERRIVLAGRPEAWPIGRVLVAKIVLGAVGFAFGWHVFGDELTGSSVLMWAGATTLAYFTPDLLLYSRGHERQLAIGQELPDTLDQMTIATEAGLGFDAAMARAAQTGDGPLATELRRTLHEVQIGVSRSVALRNLADRVSSPDLRQFVLAVTQAETYGIPIAAILRTQSAEQRVRRRQRAEEHALKVPVKIVFPLVLCILPTLLVVVLGPAVVQIVRTLF